MYNLAKEVSDIKKFMLTAISAVLVGALGVISTLANQEKDSFSPKIQVDRKGTKTFAEVYINLTQSSNITES